MIVILNEVSGGGDGSRTALRLVDALRKAGLEPRVSVVSRGSATTELAARLAGEGEQTVVAAGGDGMIGAVAQGLAGTGAALGVIPIGTFNHFAKDLGIPVEMEAAARTIAKGHAIPVDAGEVNGRIFVNNSGIGLYPSIVVKRRRREQRGTGKWLAMAWAAASAVLRFPYFSLRLTAEGKTVEGSTPFLFVGNNEYEVEGFRLGWRNRLDTGRLWFYMAPHRPGRRVAARLLLRALFGRLRQDRDFFAMSAAEGRVEMRLSTVAVALDGEVTLMRTPLDYRARPGALRVIVPAGAE
ncbi:MAG: diacylglycerol/lipid kinase family protein [Rhodospirillales bacterium]